jgi:hypothetical protein
VKEKFYPVLTEDATQEKEKLLSMFQLFQQQTNKQTNSVALSPQANYTDWVTATCQRNLVPTFMDRGVSRGQRGRSPTIVNLSYLDQNHYFSFK